MKRERRFPLTEAPCGFEWGPVTVERTASDEKFGVVITLRTKHRSVEVRMSPQGRRTEVVVFGPRPEAPGKRLEL